jgi:hypothetical protein
MSLRMNKQYILFGQNSDLRDFRTIKRLVYFPFQGVRYIEKNEGNFG